MTENPYPVGTTVFAKLKGYPWWPARIESDEDLPPNVSSKKPKQRPIWPVFFFGSYDYGWFGSSELKAFDPVSAEKTKSALKKGNGLRTALGEALDPGLISHRTAANKGQDEAEDEDESDQEPVAPAAKKRAAPKAKKVTAKSEQTPAEKKRRPSTTEDQPAKRNAPRKASANEVDEDESPKAKKRAGTISRSRLESDFKSVDDDISIGDTHNGGTKRSEDDIGDSADVRAKKKIRSGQPSPSERLLKLRHKLQKLLLVEGLSDEVLVQNLDRVDPILAEVEAFDIDLQMLKDTKIGRLMKKISNLQFSRDQHKIVERSVKLIKQYKILMEEALENGGDHHTTTQKKVAGASATPAVESTSAVSTVTGTPTITAKAQPSSVSSAEKTISETIRVGESVSATAPLANSNKNVADPSAPAPEAVVAAVAAIMENNSLAASAAGSISSATATSTAGSVQAQETITPAATEQASV